MRTSGPDFYFTGHRDWRRSDASFETFRSRACDGITVKLADGARVNISLSATWRTTDAYPFPDCTSAAPPINRLLFGSGENFLQTRARSHRAQRSCTSATPPSSVLLASMRVDERWNSKLAPDAATDFTRPEVCGGWDTKAVSQARAGVQHEPVI